MDKETEDLNIFSVDNELSYEKQTLAVCRVRLQHFFSVPGQIV